MVRRGLAVLLLIAGGGTSASAGVEPPRLSAVEIKETIVGAVLSVDTPFGSSLPVKYGEDGSLAGEAGGLSFFLGAATDRGRWWIAENRLCHKWSVWFGSEPQCLRLQRDGQRILWQRDDGTNGTATIVSRTVPIVRRDPQVAALAAPPAKAPDAADTPANTAAAPTVAAHAAASEPPSLQHTGGARAKAVAHAAAKPAAKTTAPRQAATAASAAHEGAKPARTKTPSAQQAPVLAQAAPLPQRAQRQIQDQTQTQTQAVGTRSLAVEASFRVAGVEYDDVLNVRGGPSQDYAAVGVLLPRQRGVRIVGACLEDWCPIRHGGTQGWVNRYYLMEEQPVWASEDVGPRARR